MGRIFFDTDKTDDACKVITRVFGVVSCSPVWRTPFKTIDTIVEAGLTFAEGRIKEGKTFAIRAKRAGNHPFTSMDIAKKMGAAIVEKYKVKVDLKNPDVEIYNETRQKETYLYSEAFKGPGGLPLGVEGKIVCLMSGGIDSPVAAWLMMKRGCAPTFVHFDLTPFGDERNINRVRKTVDLLRSWSYGSRPKFYIVPHGKTLEEFMKSAPRRLTCILCKRAMLKLSERIAGKERALAIVTGESMGQVASQTLPNINVESQAVRIPVLRPLVGLDKEEIIEMAKKIGTFEASTTPVQCCTAVPEHPETVGELDVIEDEENFIGIEELLQKSLNEAKIE